MATRLIKKLILFVTLLVLVGFALQGVLSYISRRHEVEVLRKVVSRLHAESRVAEALVTKSEFDESIGKVVTTVKFLEYDIDGKPLAPRYFIFHGKILQFQSLVIRFQDQWVETGDLLRGKSAYLFLKAFALEGDHVQIFPISEPGEVPEGYRVEGERDPFEKKLWERFWRFALDPVEREKLGIKNAQIEAPGTLFQPGTIYTLRIEHDGGLRIDTWPIPEVLKGEKI